MGAQSTLETRIKQLEEETTQERDSHKTILTTMQSQFTFQYDKCRAVESGSRDIILWKLTSLSYDFDNAKSSIQLDDAAKDPSTHYNSPLYRTHSHAYNSFVQLYPYVSDSAAGTHASPMFALFPGEYDDLLEWPFPKKIHLSFRDQLEPHIKWTVTFASSGKKYFRRATRDPCPSLTNFNVFPHSKKFSKTEKFLLNYTLCLELKIPNLPDPEGATLSTS